MHGRKRNPNSTPSRIYLLEPIRLHYRLPRFDPCPIFADGLHTYSLQPPSPYSLEPHHCPSGPGALLAPKGEAALKLSVSLVLNSVL